MTDADATGLQFGQGVLAQILASAITGVSVSVLACPADTIRSKLMNNGPSSPQPLHKSFRDCVVSTWRSGGITAFYRALIPMYMREAPYYLIMWNTLELLNHFRKVAVGS